MNTDRNIYMEQKRVVLFLNVQSSTCWRLSSQIFKIAIELHLPEFLKTTLHFGQLHCIYRESTFKQPIIKTNASREQLWLQSLEKHTKEVYICIYYFMSCLCNVCFTQLLLLQWDQDLGARAGPLGTAGLVVGYHLWQVSAAWGLQAW